MDNIRNAADILAKFEKHLEFHIRYFNRFFKSILCSNDTLALKNIKNDFDYNNCLFKHFLESEEITTLNISNTLKNQISEIEEIHYQLHYILDLMINEYLENKLLTEDSFNIYRKQEIDFINKMKDIVIYLSRYETRYDNLTGIYNRRYFMSKLEDELNRAERFKEDISIVMADIDFFKKVNDTYGHVCGDEVLIKVAQTCSSFIRKFDILGRYGGEEFIFMVLNDAENTQKIIERLRKHLENTVINCLNNDIKITLSFGIATTASGYDKDVLINNADIALYDAKKNGRNKICIYKKGA